jgi:hypothetical protein
MAYDQGGLGQANMEIRLLLADNTELLTTGSISAFDNTEDPGNNPTIKSRMVLEEGSGWERSKINGLKWRLGYANGDPDAHFGDFMIDVATFVQSDGTIITINTAF